METKINVAEILKDKPKGTKLYDLLYNIDVELDTIHTTDTETVVWCTNETDNNTTCHRGYSELGTVRGCSDGLRILLPSKEMQDWNKFAWKKGDVLGCIDGKCKVIFDKFDDNKYTSFIGKHYLESYGKDGELLDYEEIHFGSTDNYTKESEEAAQTYINTIEERLDGKLNHETLEIEKTQPEFKDGDILSYPEDEMSFAVVLIFKEIKDRIMAYASAVISKYPSVETKNKSFNKNKLSALRLATEEEKKLLFDALAKEGKAWDAEHKMIVDLKPKVEFKPFDKVLCRNSKDDTWEADFFARLTRKEIDYTQSGKYLCVGDLWMYCIPYNEETAHLLGTTDEWKGGEQ